MAIANGIAATYHILASNIYLTYGFWDTDLSDIPTYRTHLLRLKVNMFGWGKIFHLQERCCNGHCGMTFCCYLWVHPGSAGLGGILRLGNPFLLFISSTFTFAVMTFQRFNLLHLQSRCPSLIRFDLLQTVFLIRTIRGCAKFSGCAACSLKSDNHLILSSQSDNSSITPLAFSSSSFSYSSIACFKPVRLELEQIGGKMKHQPVAASLCKVNRFGTYRLACSCFSWHTFGILKLLAKV